MAGGNWMPELVEMAGGVNLFGEAGKHSPWMTLERAREQDPDVIVVMPCGFDIARTREEMPLLEQQPEWSELRAVRERSRLRRRRQPVLQPPRTAPRRVARDPRRDPAPRRDRLRLEGAGMGAVAAMSWKHPKVWIPAIVVLLFVIVLLQNTDVVTLRVLFWDVSMSQIILIPFGSDDRLRPRLRRCEALRRRGASQR